MSDSRYLQTATFYEQTYTWFEFEDNSYHLRMDHSDKIAIIFGLPQYSDFLYPDRFGLFVLSL